jgi:serine/threonine-protein kinase
MSIKVGDTIGDYEVVGQLGAGGMGAVFSVRHLISNRVEAMKVLLPDLEQDPDLGERFLREIRLHASLSHPGIAGLHTAFRHAQQLLMVMEYVPGESLDLLLRQKRIDLAQAMDVTVQLLAALDYAHSLAIIHRDIKPANIIVMRDSRVKLLDFGIARPVWDSNLTQTGSVIGSLSYMSPEQIRGVAVDHRTDLYATGVTLYEMTTGVRPFSGTDPYAVMRAKVEDTPPSPDTLNPWISPELARVITRSIQRDVTHRFQTAREFSRELEAARNTVRESRAPAPQQVPLANQWQPAPDNRTPTPTPSSAAPPLFLFDPEAIERLVNVLAEFMGPMARVLVKRTARKKTSWDDLYSALATELPPGPDREKFLASRRTVLFGR